MRLYEGTTKEFNDDVIQNKIADLVRERFEEYYHRRANESEYRSWQASLNILNNSLVHAQLLDNKIVVEYELPYSTRRIDVLLFGKDKDENESIVLIELKQWSNNNVYDCEVDGNVIVDFGRRKSEQAHPSLQVQGYHFDLKDFFTIFEDKNSMSLSSCAYCHNYSKNGENVLYYPKFQKTIEKFPLFSKEDVQELGKYLKQRLSKGTGVKVFNNFITSPIRPSKKLLEHTSDMINKQQIFNLIDDQIAAYNSIMHKVKKLSNVSKKSVVIIKGGPGTGKSVIALEVMGELMRKGKTVFHATGGKAFTETLRWIVGARAKSLFKFFNSFIGAKSNEIDVLICDEAHRIRETSNNRFTRRDARSNVSQINELIDVAKLTVFFIDEYQVVRPNEIGNIELIKETAIKFGVEESEISEFELKTQFRCSGSDEYLKWLDSMLGIRKFKTSDFDEKMEFKIFDSPLELKKAIDKKNEENENSARIVAGFCWPWSNPNLDGSLINDVKIGDFEMPWEKKNQFWKWATDKSGMEQVGTVYTAQGFEFDYIGVIFGNDLVFDASKKDWVAVVGNSYDVMVTRNNPELVSHFKNVYRVLMSRAHRGVYIYFMDNSTREYFEKMIKK